MNTFEHRGYTVYHQPQGGFYVCGLKVVAQDQNEARRLIDDYLANNKKARQEALVKEARAASR